MKTIVKMFEHLQWADQRILERLKNAEVEDQHIIKLFKHLLSAEQVWVTRLKGMDSSHISIWTEDDIAVCAKIIKQNEESFKEYLNELKNIDLDNVIVYKNSNGIAFKNSIRDILTHVALHGQYHRGQINSRLRIEGIEPIGVDYITFVR